MTSFASSAISSLIDSPVRYDLGESTSPSLRISDVVDPAVLADLSLDYGTSRGDVELRELIAADAGVDAEQVLVTVGAIEALFLLALDRCRPGDRALVAAPYFPPTHAVPDGLGLQVDELRLRFDDGYRLPLDAAADVLTPQTRLVSLASPQNPSGVRFTDDELRALVALVEERAPGGGGAPPPTPSCSLTRPTGRRPTATSRCRRRPPRCRRGW
jgi:aspartate/methionine/tyrosine aminotransferase